MWPKSGGQHQPASEPDTPHARQSEPTHCLPDVRASSLTGQTGWHGTASNTKYYPICATLLKLPAASGLLLAGTQHSNTHRLPEAQYHTFYITMANIWFQIVKHLKSNVLMAVETLVISFQGWKAKNVRKSCGVGLQVVSDQRWQL